jgi:hypothetical protein
MLRPGIQVVKLLESQSTWLAIAEYDPTVVSLDSRLLLELLLCLFTDQRTITD